MTPTARRAGTRRSPASDPGQRRHARHAQSRRDRDGAGLGRHVLHLAGRRQDPADRQIEADRAGDAGPANVLRGACDVVILGSGIAGLAGALAAHELGLRPLVLEKAGTLGGGTVHSYGLIWVGQNHLAEAAGYRDTRDEVIAYLRFLAGGSFDDDRMSAFVDRSPEAIKFFADCGVRFRLIRGLTDHYYGIAPGARAVGRSVEAELISGLDLGDGRER